VIPLQEEIEYKTIQLTISTARMSGNVLRTALTKYLDYCKHRRLQKAHGDVKPTGKQSLKQLIGQNQGVVNIEITDQNIRDFDRVARKYGVDYALKKDKSGEHPKYLVFFKARDSDALTAAFTEYTQRALKQKNKPSVREKLREIKLSMLSLDPVKIRKKELER
jgi:hypothetical protein